ncbi:MAG: hypothetical protein EZS28_023608 [Streblomastix strix]|uniref:Uncharacterized protein n=1 Tax=Streblomastix strix TaxID=222440 RepID=A0A5J4VEK7_9EUKA|nr:MAG: hypothetical protein EZS28_023608 [Streblomastix strix]
MRLSQRKIRQSSENRCEQLIKILEEDKSGKMGKITIEQGVAKLIIDIFEKWSVDFITQPFVKAFYHITTSNKENIKLLLSKYPFPGLFRLFDHSNISVVEYSIKSIFNIIKADEDINQTDAKHPDFEAIQSSGGIDAIFSVFNRKLSKQSRDWAALTIAFLFQSQTFPDQTLKQEVVNYLNSLLRDRDQQVKEMAQVAVERFQLHGQKVEIDQNIDSFISVTYILQIPLLGNQTQKQKILFQQENSLVRIIKLLESYESEELRENMIRDGVAKEIINVFNTRALEQITLPYVQTFSLLTYHKIVDVIQKLLEYDLLFPTLFRLLTHPDTKIINFIITAIMNILSVIADSTPQNTPHPSFDKLSSFGGVDKIYNTFMWYTNQLQKDASALCIGYLFRAREIADTSLNNDVTSHLNSLLTSQDEYMRFSARVVLEGITMQQYAEQDQDYNSSSLKLIPLDKSEANKQFQPFKPSLPSKSSSLTILPPPFRPKLATKPPIPPQPPKTKPPQLLPDQQQTPLSNPTSPMMPIQGTPPVVPSTSPVKSVTSPSISNSTTPTVPVVAPMPRSIGSLSGSLKIPANVSDYAQVFAKQLTILKNDVPVCAAFNNGISNGIWRAQVKFANCKDSRGQYVAGFGIMPNSQTITCPCDPEQNNSMLCYLGNGSVSYKGQKSTGNQLISGGQAMIMELNMQKENEIFDEINQNPYIGRDIQDTLGLFIDTVRAIEWCLRIGTQDFFLEIENAQSRIDMKVIDPTPHLSGFGPPLGPNKTSQQAKAEKPTAALVEILKRLGLVKTQGSFNLNKDDNDQANSFGRVNKLLVLMPYQIIQKLDSKQSDQHSPMNKLKQTASTQKLQGQLQEIIQEKKRKQKLEEAGRVTVDESTGLPWILKENVKLLVEALFSEAPTSTKPRNDADNIDNEQDVTNQYVFDDKKYYISSNTPYFMFAQRPSFLKQAIIGGIIFIRLVGSALPEGNELQSQVALIIRFISGAMLNKVQVIIDPNDPNINSNFSDTKASIQLNTINTKSKVDTQTQTQKGDKRRRSLNSASQPIPTQIASNKRSTPAQQRRVSGLSGTLQLLGSTTYRSAATKPIYLSLGQNVPQSEFLEYIDELIGSFSDNFTIIAQSIIFVDRAIRIHQIVPPMQVIAQITNALLIFVQDAQEQQESKLQQTQGYDINRSITNIASDLYSESSPAKLILLQLLRPFTDSFLTFRTSKIMSYCNV